MSAHHKFQIINYKMFLFLLPSRIWSKGIWVQSVWNVSSGLIITNLEQDSYIGSRTSALTRKVNAEKCPKKQNQEDMNFWNNANSHPLWSLSFLLHSILYSFWLFTIDFGSPPVLLFPFVQTENLTLLKNSLILWRDSCPFQKEWREEKMCKYRIYNSYSPTGMS